MGAGAGNPIPVGKSRAVSTEPAQPPGSLSGNSGPCPSPCHVLRASKLIPPKAPHLLSPSWFRSHPLPTTGSSSLASLPPVSTPLCLSPTSLHRGPSTPCPPALFHLRVSLSPLPASLLHLTHAPLLPPQTSTCHQTQVPIQNT